MNPRAYSQCIPTSLLKRRTFLLVITSMFDVSGTASDEIVASPSFWMSIQTTQLLPIKRELNQSHCVANRSSVEREHVNL